MAVGFGSVGLGDGAGANNATSVTAQFRHNSPGGLVVVPIVFSAGNFQFLWLEKSNELDDLTRTVTYGGVPMESAGVVAWNNTEDAWTEAFVLFNAPAGEQVVSARVHGGVAATRRLRVSAVTYTGVDSIGDPILAFGSGTSMTISGTAAVNDRLVGVFGTQSGISNFNGDQRYLTNTVPSLLVGDVVGTGSLQAVTATRQKSGKWSGIVLPLNAADTVGASDPLAFAPRFGGVRVHREQRTGGLQRNVFTVEAPEV